MMNYTGKQQSTTNNSTSNMNYDKNNIYQLRRMSNRDNTGQVVAYLEMQLGTKEDASVKHKTEYEVYQETDNAHNA